MHRIEGTRRPKPQKSSHDNVPEELPANKGADCHGCRVGKRKGHRFCSECGQELIPSAAGSGLTETDEDNDDRRSRVTPKLPPHGESTVRTREPVRRSRGRADDAKAARPGEPSGKLRCPCGEPLSGRARFCLTCGQQVNQACVLRLVESSEGADAHALDLTDGEFTIGKDPSCELVVEGDKYVSRRHARLTVAGDTVSLDDIGSANGTYLRVKRSIPIEPGDEFIIGTRRFRVESR